MNIKLPPESILILITHIAEFHDVEESEVTEQQVQSLIVDLIRGADNEGNIAEDYSSEQQH